MKRLLITGLGLFCIVFSVCAQERYDPEDQSLVHEGEFGISAGAAHYFGDLNPDYHFNRPKPAVGLFFRKQFGNYIALRVAGHFAQVGYSDIYNTQNAFELRRNLSFNSNIWELGIQGDFNFFKFIPGDANHRSTPYITFGVGLFSFDPYAYYQGQKVYLRELGTEGQGTPAYPGRKPYANIAAYIPLGVGYKYNLNPGMNIGFEVVYRFTTTDYLDDVSTTYAGIDNFPKGSTAAALQDRSYETGTPIGVAGKQRGYSNQNDGYLFAEIMLSFNITSYRCPTAK
ncbi:MAG: DUF6089 family protein [Bacteroidota bacterium]|nr:DUF6089 family protein [Bacteroidota bacterium]MDP4212237.1 DUF6089 family protein [Bacteroidota bacterium]MDP4251353.1 DUF6089 family protein [Bacteroidota bacterium]